MIKYISQDELYHHGIKGQKWGVRRFRNADGSLTAAGKRRRASEEKSKELREQAERIGKNTTAYKMQERYFKKNPDADADDFGDYLTSHKKASSRYDKSIESESYKNAEQLSSDSYKLSKNYVKNQTVGAAFVSSMTLAPVAGLMAAAIAPKGKKKTAGMLTAIGTVSAVTLASSVTSSKEKRDTQRKYGIR